MCFPAINFLQFITYLTHLLVQLFHTLSYYLITWLYVYHSFYHINAGCVPSSHHILRLDVFPAINFLHFINLPLSTFGATILHISYYPIAWLYVFHSSYHNSKEGWVFPTHPLLHLSIYITHFLV